MRTKRGIFAILMLGGVLLTACGGSASDLGWENFDRTYTSVPDRDGWIWSAGAVHPSANTRAGDYDGLIDASGVTSVFCFNTGGISDDAVVESATLRVYQGVVLGTPYTALGNLVVDHVQIGADLDQDDYDGGNLTPNIGTLSSSASLGWKTLDVTAAVQNDVSAGRTNSEFRMRFTTEWDDDDHNDQILGNDGEDSEGSGNVPELVVSYRSPRL